MHEAAAAIDAAMLFVATNFAWKWCRCGDALQFEHVVTLAEVAKIPLASILAKQLKTKIRMCSKKKRSKTGCDH